MHCRHCGKEVYPKAEFCAFCGNKASDGDYFCQNCGAETQPNQEMCIKCGAKLLEARPAINEMHILWCILSYGYIFSLIPFLTQKDNKFIQFHAKQGVALLLIAAALLIFLMFLGFIPVITELMSMVSFLLHLALFLISLLGISQAFTGSKFRIPVVANIADRINF